MLTACRWFRAARCDTSTEDAGYDGCDLHEDRPVHAGHQYGQACVSVECVCIQLHLTSDSNATVHNSVAYRALGLEFELWSYASLGVVSFYLQHFQYLLSTSKHARYNILRTFQKSAVVRKVLYTLRSGLFDPTVVPVVVGQLRSGHYLLDADSASDTLRLALVARWSATDSIKPVFSYLVSTLCQGMLRHPLTWRCLRVHYRERLVFDHAIDRTLAVPRASDRHSCHDCRTRARRTTIAQAPQVARHLSPSRGLHLEQWRILCRTPVS